MKRLDFLRRECNGRQQIAYFIVGKGFTVRYDDGGAVCNYRFDDNKYRRIQNPQKYSTMAWPYGLTRKRRLDAEAVRSPKRIVSMKEWAWIG